MRAPYLHRWIRSSKAGTIGVPFKEFKSVVAKIRHAFMAVPAGRGLLTPCNKSFKQNHHLSTSSATRCYGPL